MIPQHPLHSKRFAPPQPVRQLWPISFPQSVIYANAFTDFTADLLCTYRIGGFESDVIFRQQPPSPEDYGLNPATTRVQLLTEFFDTSDPAVGMTTEINGLSDSRFKFGTMRMVQGKAFL